MSEDLESNLGGAKLSWTDERVELLKKLWTEGLSASQIAGRLGAGVTRNAVIGKVHRLNLSGRVQQQRTAQPRTPRKQREPSLAPRAGGNGGGMPSMPTAGNTALKPMMRAETHVRPASLPEPQPLRLVDLPKDGRVTILMPHPERGFGAVQHSWRPREWRQDGPWMRLFRNARVWVG